jgi:trans-2,3-dihydro-3-hydroxyanthranilate isomerase
MPMPRRYPFIQVNAFTTSRFGGNQCAVVFDADTLSDAEMLAIAHDFNYSETAYVLRSDRADIRARYFTPAEEIPLAGHPTVATIRALLEAGVIAPAGPTHRLTLELKAGLIPITVNQGADGGWTVSMQQPAPTFLRVYDPAQAMPAFGLTADDVLPGAPVQTVSTGTPQLMMHVTGPEALARARVDNVLYAALRAEGDFFSPHLFYVAEENGQPVTHARHFGLPPDAPEDPFTGSATGGMGAYLWHHGLIGASSFTAYQGAPMNRPGSASVQVIGPPDAISGVIISGAGVVTMRGELFV